MMAHFRDEEDGGFYDTSDDHEELIHRPKDVQDNAVPSGNAMAALVLLKASLYTGNGTYWDVAEEAVSAMVGAMSKYPTGFAQWLNAALHMASEPKEIAIVGDPEAQDTRDLLDVAFGTYRPHQVVAVGEDGQTVPLLRDRKRIDGQATAFVCRRFVCRQPVADPQALAEQLAGD
jgi:uncharacterized protein YyaL (SSP411 family)